MFNPTGKKGASNVTTEAEERSTPLSSKAEKPLQQSQVKRRAGKGPASLQTRAEKLTCSKSPQCATRWKKIHKGAPLQERQAEQPSGLGLLSPPGVCLKAL